MFNSEHENSCHTSEGSQLYLQDTVAFIIPACARKHGSLTMVIWTIKALQHSLGFKYLIGKSDIGSLKTLCHACMATGGEARENGIWSMSRVEIARKILLCRHSDL